jgi:hypothetical protein
MHPDLRREEVVVVSDFLGHHPVSRFPDGSTSATEEKQLSHTTGRGPWLMGSWIAASGAHHVVAPSPRNLQRHFGLSSAKAALRPI